MLIIYEKKRVGGCAFSQRRAVSFSTSSPVANSSEILTLSKVSQYYPVFPDAPFLLRFLRAKKFSVPMAQEALERYILLRTTYGDLAFSKLDPKNPTMQELLNLG